MFTRLRSIRTFIIITLIFIGGNFIIPSYFHVNEPVIGVENVSADTNTADAKQTTIAQTKENPEEVKFINLVDTVIKLLSVMVTPMVSFAGWLLSPDWTHGDLFGVRDVLYKIWIMTSNLAYFGYAFLLVISAISTMFWPDKHRLQLGALLPRLAIGILFIPFTLWIINASLSVANILTTSVIGIPYDMIKNGNIPNVEGSAWFSKDKVIPKTILIDMTDLNDPKASTDQTVARANETFDCKDASKCMTVQEFMESLNTGPYSLLIGYAYGAFRMQNYKVITDGLLKTITSLSKVVLVTAFAAVTYVAFAILMFALCFVLFTRAIRMWFYIAFSPFMTFYYVFQGKQEEKNHMNISGFISLAMVPVFVSGALAFGFLFISLLNGVILRQDTTNSNAKNCEIACKDVTIKGSEINNGNGCIASGKDQKGIPLSGFKMGALSFCIAGQLIAGDEKSGSDGTETNVLATIISSFLGLAILWMAVRAALSTSKVTESAMNTLKPLLDLTQSLPKYMPIPGLPGKSIAGAEKILSGVPEGFQAQLRSKIQKDFEEGPGRTLGFTPNPNGDILKRLEKTGIQNETDKRELQNAISGKFDEQGGYTDKFFRETGPYIGNIVTDSRNAEQLRNMQINTEELEALKKNPSDPNNKFNKNYRTGLAKLGGRPTDVAMINPDQKEYTVTINDNNKIQVPFNEDESQTIAKIVEAIKKANLGNSDVKAIVKGSDISPKERKDRIADKVYEEIEKWKRQQTQSGGNPPRNGA